MIIELFGAPGVGKTTIACALATRLRERGYAVELVSSLSYRSTEHDRNGGVRHGMRAALRRLTTPVFEMLSSAVDLPAREHEPGAAAKLLRILPPRNLWWSIRMRQYILRLACAWHGVFVPGQIVVFDQGFVQAVYSLALVGRAVDEDLVERALDSIPISDLLIRLDAPREVLAARLAERQRFQSRIERLLELDPKTNVASVTVIDQVQELLLRRGRPVMCANSLDQASLYEAVARIEREIVARLCPEPAVTA